MFERELATTAAAVVAPGKGVLAKGRPASVAAAQKALFHRANMNSAACFGRYNAGMEKDAPPA